MNEQATQFFLGFIQDTIQLKIMIADYNSFFINMSFGLERIPKEKQREEILKRFTSLTIEEKTALLTLLNNIRRISFSLQIDLESLKGNINIVPEQQQILEENYKEIEEQSLPDYKKCKAYLQELNNIKVRHINIQALIISKEKEERAMQGMQTPRDVSFGNQ